MSSSSTATTATTATSSQQINGKVVLHTTRGEIEIGLFANSAPDQCRLFLDWISSFSNSNIENENENENEDEGKEKCIPCCFQRYTIYLFNIKTLTCHTSIQKFYLNLLYIN